MKQKHERIKGVALVLDQATSMNNVYPKEFANKMGLPKVVPLTITPNSKHIIGMVKLYLEDDKVMFETVTDDPKMFQETMVCPSSIGEQLKDNKFQIKEFRSCFFGIIHSQHEHIGKYETIEFIDNIDYEKCPGCKQPFKEGHVVYTKDGLDSQPYCSKTCLEKNK